MISHILLKLQVKIQKLQNFLTDRWLNKNRVVGLSLIVLFQEAPNCSSQSNLNPLLKQQLPLSISSRINSPNKIMKISIKMMTVILSVKTSQSSKDHCLCLIKKLRRVKLESSILLSEKYYNLKKIIIKNNQFFNF